MSLRWSTRSYRIDLIHYSYSLCHCAPVTLTSLLSLIKVRYSLASYSVHWLFSLHRRCFPLMSQISLQQKLFSLSSTVIFNKVYTDLSKIESLTPRHSHPHYSALFLQYYYFLTHDLINFINIFIIYLCQVEFQFPTRKRLLLSVCRYIHVHTHVYPVLGECLFLSKCSMNISGMSTSATSSKI